MRLVVEAPSEPEIRQRMPAVDDEVARIFEMLGNDLGSDQRGKRVGQNLNSSNTLGAFSAG